MNELLAMNETTATALKAVALVLVLGVFVTIAVRVFTTRQHVHDDAAQLPLDADGAPVRTPRRTQDLEERHV